MTKGNDCPTTAYYMHIQYTMNTCRISFSQILFLLYIIILFLVRCQNLCAIQRNETKQFSWMLILGVEWKHMWTYWHTFWCVSFLIYLSSSFVQLKFISILWAIFHLFLWTINKKETVIKNHKLCVAVADLTLTQYSLYFCPINNNY